LKSKVNQQQNLSQEDWEDASHPDTAACIKGADGVMCSTNNSCEATLYMYFRGTESTCMSEPHLVACGLSAFCTQSSHATQ
jgi:hypothetical protein